MRLKDVDNVRDLFDAEFKETRKLILAGETHLDNLAEGFTEADRVIRQMPTVDAVPVVYGRWGTGRFNLETGNYEEQCTRCRNFSKEYGKPYCPNCGAKMDIENGSVDHDA